MSNRRYSIGLDFGTLSARAVIADVSDGSLLPYESIFTYPHAIITSIDGKALPPNYALQHPLDYINALEFLISDLISKNHISAKEIIGIGIDFTDCTVFPVNESFTPLCLLDKYKNEPHAYAKLWKHHTSEKYAQEIERAALKYDSSILSVTGRKMTSEFLIPKLYEIFCEARDVYDDTYKFILGGDFIACLLTGRNDIHSNAFTAKQHYNGTKFPERAFFASVDPDFSGAYEEKTVTSISSVECSVGTLCKEWAERTGLSQSVAVAAPIIDAHSAISASGIETGCAVLAFGTSAVVEAVTEQKSSIKGVLAQSYETVASKLTTIEAGLAAMGDLFDWFINNSLPERYLKQAEKQGLNAHQYLRSLAEKQKIGEHGLIALDWWNGSRSITLNNDLSGMIIGLSLSSKPEDIYRALLESTAFGIRRIFDCFLSQNVKINRICATGGIASKDPLLMQICASVLNMPIESLASSQATALGSAIYGAVASGAYSSVKSASESMKRPVERIYYPSESEHIAYEKIYSQYLTLCEYFSKENPVMEFLSHNKSN